LTELGWRPDKVTYCEPDVLIFPASGSPSRVRPADVLLAIEIADTSEAYDLGTKAKVYAGLGVHEYWVVIASSLTIRVHRKPGKRGFTSIRDVPPSKSIKPAHLPAISLKIGDLGIEPEA
jgi:Uma2 family endonuclease